MVGECEKSLLEEMNNIKHNIKIYSDRVQGFEDDLLLFATEELLDDVKQLLTIKKILREDYKRNI